MRPLGSRVHVYRASRRWRAFFFIVTPLMVALFGWFMVMPFLEGRADSAGLVVFCFLFGGGFVILFVYALLSVVRGRIEVYPDRIRDVGLFRTNQLRIDNIRGFRVVPTQYVPTLELLPKDPGARKIKTALIVAHRDDLIKRLERAFVNLEDADRREEMATILGDSRLGETETQRQARLHRARAWSRGLNGLALAAMLWALFRPRPYPYLIWALVALPLLTLAVVHRFGGVMVLNGKRNSTFPDVTGAFLMPCLGLTLRAFIEIDIDRRPGHGLRERA